MKTIGTQVLIGIFLLFVAFQSFNLYFKEHQEVKRLQSDLIASQSQAEYFKAKDGQNAVKLQAMELTVKELRKVFPGVIQQAKNLYIPPRNIQGYTQAISQGVTQVRAAVHDSIIHDTIKVGVINHRAKFYTVTGIFRPDSALLKISSIDTLTIFDASGRRVRPWLWIFSRKGPDQIIIQNANPDNKIILNKTIKIKNNGLF
jgi:hypothetical protein